MLPLLLTTSHHNLLDAPNSPDDEIGVEEGVDKQAARAKGLPTVCFKSKFCCVHINYAGTFLTFFPFNFL